MESTQKFEPPLLRPAGGADLELRILSGFHQGAALTLTEEGLTVGSDPDCEVVLLDDGIHDRHLRILRKSGRWWCEPVAGADALAADGSSVNAPRPIDAGLQVKAAGVWMSFESLDTPWGSAPALTPGRIGAARAAGGTAAVVDAGRGSSRKRLLAWCAIGIALALAGGATTWLLQKQAKSDEMAAAVAAAASATPTAAKPPTPTAAQLRDSAMQILDGLQLSNLVEVTAREGYIHLEGSLAAYERDRFEQALRMLQARFGNTTRIGGKFHPLTATLPFKVRQVLMGPDSYITLNDGRRMYVGEEIDGTRLAAIRPGRLQFSGKVRAEVPW